MEAMHSEEEHRADAGAVMDPSSIGQGGEGSDSSDSGEGRRDGQDAPEFYDPELDEEDEGWVQKQRQGRRSDALLSCPGCLTTCCIDCQQHDYKDQYRAMFVTNCRVDFDEIVVVGGQASSKKRLREGGSAQKQAPEEVFHPFFCMLCGTKLGLYDSDEVFHFVGVIASEP